MLNSFVYYFFSSFRAYCLEPMSRSFYNRPVEVNAFVSKFTMFPKRLLSLCVLRFLCRLRPVCCALFMVTFLRRLFLLTLSYIATKDCRFGNVTRRGVTRHPNNILSLRISPWLSSPFTTKYFLITGLAIAANAGLANEPNIGAISRNLPFCLRLFRLSPIYQTPLLTNCFLFILKSRRLVEICYKFYDIT